MTKKGGYRRVVAATVALVAVSACGCTGALRGAVGDNVDHSGSLVSKEGQIAFTRATSFEADLEADIYVLDVDGSGRKRLTDISGNDHWPPTWSPDGGRIAFTSDGTAQMGEIYAMNSDGTGLTRLTYARAYDTFPAWRP